MFLTWVSPYSVALCSRCSHYNNHLLTQYQTEITGIILSKEPIVVEYYLFVVNNAHLDISDISYTIYFL